MRYLPSTTQKNDVPDTEAPGTAPDGDDLFDVTAQSASSAPKEPPSAYEPITFKFMKWFGRFTYTWLNPRTIGTKRLAVTLALLVLVGWPLTSAVAYLASLVPPEICAGIFAGLGLTTGAGLMAASQRNGDDVAYGRVYMALLFAGAVTLAGWLPQAILLTAIGPAAISYGVGSFAVILASAFTTPVRQSTVVVDIDEDDPETHHPSDQPS